MYKDFEFLLCALQTKFRCNCQEAFVKHHHFGGGGSNFIYTTFTSIMYSGDNVARRLKVVHY